jgi:hypothetical protein
MKLMHILNLIEKKLDKESGSSKSGSHKSPNEKRREINVIRHRHHSPRNSNKRAHNNSIPSLVRKHKWSGVDELRGEMKKIKPPTFDGEHKDEDTETWLLGMKIIFNCIIIILMQKVEFPYINSRERHPCSVIILCKCNTLKKKVLLGGNSRSILRRNA